MRANKIAKIKNIGAKSLPIDFVFSWGLSEIVVVDWSSTDLPFGVVCILIISL